MEHSVEREERFEDLLVELKDTELQLAEVTSAKFNKETEARIEKEMASKKGYVDAEAKKYGQNPEVAYSALAAYEGGLQNVRGEFVLGKDAILIQNAELNKAELESLADARGLQLELQSGDLSEQERADKEELLKGCRTMAESAVAGSDEALVAVDQTKEEYDEFFDDMVEEKSLVAQEKQNPLAKLFKRLTSKVNGKKKFETEVVDSLETKAEDIEENKVPEAREQVEASLGDKIKSILGKVKDKVNELGNWAVEKLEQLNVSKKVISGLLLAAKTAGALFGIYSAVNLGLDLSVAVGEWLRGRMQPENPSMGGPALA